MINNDPRHIKDAETFLAHGHRKRYSAKSTIIYAGDKADILYYVVKGTVSVLVEDRKKQQRDDCRLFKPRRFFWRDGTF